jgi:hypothetical protein
MAARIQSHLINPVAVCIAGSIHARAFAFIRFAPIDIAGYEIWKCPAVTDRRYKGM